MKRLQEFKIGNKKCENLSICDIKHIDKLDDKGNFVKSIGEERSNPNEFSHKSPNMLRTVFVTIAIAVAFIKYDFVSIYF